MNKNIINRIDRVYIFCYSIGIILFFIGSYKKYLEGVLYICIIYIFEKSIKDMLKYVIFI